MQAVVLRPEETLPAAVHKVRNIDESIYVTVPGPAPGAVLGGESSEQAQAQPAADAPARKINATLANMVGF